jgi:diguanylate cyclase (GGDEF)-like protein/PAS domain S-box-containing protein
MDDLLLGIKRKQNGDLKYEISVKSKDEFGQMAVLFENVFEKMLESDHRYETIVDMTDNIIFEVNYKKNTVFTSKNFNKKFSLRPKDDTIKESFLYKTHVHKDDKQRYEQDLEGILGPSNTLQGEYRVKNVYGDFGWIALKANKFFDRNDRPTKVVGVIVDIDREKKSKMSLLQRASFDNLTQLFNREAFLKALQNELEVSGMKKNLSAIMFIDLDDFKFFNDEFGHACGDEVLKFVADTLKEISFERGFAGRFGGDEFVVCLTNLTLYGDTGKSAQEIIDVLGKGFTSESTGERLEVHCSIGIAFLRENGKTCEDVIAAADEAMYNIKKHGKSAFAFAKARESGEKSASYDETIASIASIDSDGPAEGKESEEQEAVVMEDMLL